MKGKVMSDEEREEQDEKEKKLARQIRRMKKISEAAGHSKYHSVRCPDD